MSHVYPLAKQAMESAQINLPADNIRIVFLGSTYVYNATHQYFTDLTSTIGTASSPLTAKTVTLGVFDAADVTITAVASGSTITQIAGYKDTGTPGTSPLIWLHEGLSQATNGGDVLVQWNASGIFAL